MRTRKLLLKHLSRVNHRERDPETSPETGGWMWSTKTCKVKERTTGKLYNSILGEVAGNEQRDEYVVWFYSGMRGYCLFIFVPKYDIFN